MGPSSCFSTGHLLLICLLGELALACGTLDTQFHILERVEDYSSGAPDWKSSGGNGSSLVPLPQHILLDVYTI